MRQISGSHSDEYEEGFLLDVVPVPCDLVAVQKCFLIYGGNIRCGHLKYITGPMKEINNRCYKIKKENEIFLESVKQD
jgi:hypothetical protein